MSCAAATEPGGPLTSTYTLAADKSELDEQFRAVISATSHADCPGGILSPGPWHHNATPQQEQGTVYCGFRGEAPVVAWTDTPKLVLNVAESSSTGPTLDALYGWWTSHS